MRESGFTLIELGLTLVLFAILAAVTIPNLFDFATEGKNAVTQGSLGGIRAAIGIARANIAVKEDVGTPPYPKTSEMQANRFNGAYHPVLSGAYIMDVATGFPKNPWTLDTLPIPHFSSVVDCTSLSKGFIHSTSGADFRGWCYNEDTGEAWANSDRNQGGPLKTENYY